MDRIFRLGINRRPNWRRLVADHLQTAGWYVTHEDITRAYRDEDAGVFDVLVKNKALPREIRPFTMDRSVK